MKRLQLHDEVEADLDRIWNWLALDQKVPEAADRVQDAIEASFRLLARHPGAGFIRWRDMPELAEVRLLAVPRYHNYLVFYREVRDAVQIIAVLHGRRDLPRRLLETGRLN